MNLTANHLGALLTALNNKADDEGYACSSSAALVTLLHWGAMPVTELAAVLGLSQPATSRLLDRLEQAGMAQRIPSENGGREKPVVLTPVGTAHAQDVQNARQSDLEQALSVLDPDEAAAFSKAVDKILTGLVVSSADARRICRLCDHGVCTGAVCPVGQRATALEGAMP